MASGISAKAQLAIGLTAMVATMGVLYPAENRSARGDELAAAEMTAGVAAGGALDRQPDSGK